MPPLTGRNGQLGLGPRIVLFVSLPLLVLVAATVAVAVEGRSGPGPGVDHSSGVDQSSGVDHGSGVDHDLDVALTDLSRPHTGAAAQQAVSRLHDAIARASAQDGAASVTDRVNKAVDVALSTPEGRSALRVTDTALNGTRLGASPGSTSPGSTSPGSTSSGTVRDMPTALAPSSASATATLVAGTARTGDRIAYDPSLAIDGRRETAWCAPGDGSGQTLTVNFDHLVEVRTVSIVVGYDKIDHGQDRFTQNRRLTRVRVAGSGVAGSGESGTEQTLDPTIRTGQTVSLRNAATTTSISITPMATTAGEDTCISEVTFTGRTTAGGAVTAPSGQALGPAHRSGPTESIHAQSIRVELAAATSAPKLRVYFVNGVLNTWPAALASANQLALALHVPDVIPVYNHSFLQVGDYEFLACARAMERINIANEDKMTWSEFLSMHISDAVAKGLHAACKTLEVTGKITVGAFDLARGVTESVLQRLIDADAVSAAVNAELVPQLKNDIRDGYKIILIGHSQGTLFIRNSMGQLASWWQDEINAGHVRTGGCTATESDDSAVLSGVHRPPVAALSIAPAFSRSSFFLSLPGEKEALNEGSNRYVMLHGDILNVGRFSFRGPAALEEEAGGGIAIAPLPATAEPTPEQGNPSSPNPVRHLLIHMLSTYLMDGTESRRQIETRFAELVDYVSGVQGFEDPCATSSDASPTEQDPSEAISSAPTTSLPQVAPGLPSLQCPAKLGDAPLYLAGRPVRKGDSDFECDYGGYYATTDSLLRVHVEWAPPPTGSVQCHGAAADRYGNVSVYSATKQAYARYPKDNAAGQALAQRLLTSVEPYSLPCSR